MTTCPFCKRDPFHYENVGVGWVPVAVTCCELGDAFFRGARPELTDDIPLAPDEFMDIGRQLLELEKYKEKYGELYPEPEPTP